ncbi:MAG: ester cyclase [Halobacteriales archaeon]|nr:ester cyclase [Halobacteriales archaeon]
MPTPEENAALVHRHAVHEHRRELPQLLATVSDDAVYEDVPRGLRWEGKKDVERFYLELLGAFPDIDFHLEARRAGVDHVLEELTATATHLGPLQGPGGQPLAPTGKKVRFRLVIVFPVAKDGRLGGEIVYYDLATIYRQLGMLPAGL